MTILSNLLGKSFSEKVETCHSENLDDPQYAAKFLYGCDKRHKLMGADPFAKDTAIKMLSVHGYQPSGKISANVLEGYSPEKRLICDALEEIAVKGELAAETIADLQVLIDARKASDFQAARAVQPTVPAPSGNSF